MAGTPNKEFGRRKPVAIPAAHPVKRSSHVALLLMGTLAVGGGAYALMPGENCELNRPGMALPSGAECPPRGSSSAVAHGSSGGSSAHYGFFSGNSSSSRSPTVASSDSGSGGVTRGGFGSFARAFASHFSVGA